MPDPHLGVMLRWDFLLGSRDLPLSKRDFSGWNGNMSNRPGFGSVFLILRSPRLWEFTGAPGWNARAWICLCSEGDYALLSSAKFMAVNVSTRGRCCNSRRTKCQNATEERLERALIAPMNQCHPRLPRHHRCTRCTSAWAREVFPKVLLNRQLWIPLPPL